MSKSIKQNVKFDVSPKIIYEMLIDSKMHSAFTGEKDSIDKKVGGKFTVYGGYINGINVELTPGKRIVQVWACQNFPKGVYSLVSFELKKSKGGTTLSFSHDGVPSSIRNRLNSGWHTHYWNKMKEYSEK